MYACSSCQIRVLRHARFGRAPLCVQTGSVKSPCDARGGPCHRLAARLAPYFLRCRAPAGSVRDRMTGPGRRRSFLRRLRAAGTTRNAGVVHAPGRAVAAASTARSGRGQHPRRHQAARAGRRDHAPAGAALRRRRRHPLQRHRRAGRTPSASASTWRPAPDRSSPQPVPATRRPRPPPPARARGRHAYVARDRSACWPRSSTVPLIGFAGAPFTVASYLDRGRPSRSYALHEGADVRRRARSGTPARAPGRPGLAIACASQVADGAAGACSCSTPGPARSRPADYARYVLPHSRTGVRRGLADPRRAHGSTSASTPANCWA